MPKLNVLIAGSTGYIGVQLIKLLVKHNNIKIKYLCGNSSVGKNISHYEKLLIKNKLPKIKSGIFSIVDNDKKMEEETVDKINIIYAKDYNIMLDLKILVKNIFKTN